MFLYTEKGYAYMLCCLEDLPSLQIIWNAFLLYYCVMFKFMFVIHSPPLHCCCCRMAWSFNMLGAHFNSDKPTASLLQVRLHIWIKKSTFMLLLVKQVGDSRGRPSALPNSTYQTVLRQGTSILWLVGTLALRGSSVIIGVWENGWMRGQLWSTLSSKVEEQHISADHLAFTDTHSSTRLHHSNKVKR